MQQLIGFNLLLRWPSSWLHPRHGPPCARPDPLTRVPAPSPSLLTAAPGAGSGAAGVAGPAARAGGAAAGAAGARLGLGWGAWRAAVHIPVVPHLPAAAARQRPRCPPCPPLLPLLTLPNARAAASQARISGLESDLALMRVDIRSSQDKARAAAKDIEALAKVGRRRAFDGAAPHGRVALAAERPSCAAALQRCSACRLACPAPSPPCLPFF